MIRITDGAAARMAGQQGGEPASGAGGGGADGGQLVTPEKV